VELFGVADWALAAIAVAVAVGAAVQGAVGLGLGLVAAPVTALVAPSLMPGVPLWLAAGLTTATLARERSDIDWGGLTWALPARAAGTILGVLVVTWVADRTLGLAVGVMVLVAVVLSVRTIDVPITRGSLLTAGFVAGTTGTATSIAGPPVALLYQRRPGRQVRSTLAVFFLVGVLLSLAGLAIGDALTLRELEVALALAPALLLGFAVAGPLRSRVDAGHTRTAVLTVCAASALALLVRGAVG
jgi:uncharacterized membrane protein YfcA